MKNLKHISFFIALLVGVMYVSYADRGIGKKKTKVTFNIKAPANFSSSLNFNLRNGMKYTGSSVISSTANTNTRSTNSLITYQKGKNVFIVPYKQKVVVADNSQGFVGTKLILKIKH